MWSNDTLGTSLYRSLRSTFKGSIDLFLQRRLYLTFEMTIPTSACEAVALLRASLLALNKVYTDAVSWQIP